jgi:hypothetical protein
MFQHITSPPDSPAFALLELGLLIILGLSPSGCIFLGLLRCRVYVCVCVCVCGIKLPIGSVSLENPNYYSIQGMTIIH